MKMPVEEEVSHSFDVADSDSDVEDKKGHSKLVSAISRLDRKQRVKPPSRKESSVQVSEFHLTKQKKHNTNNAVNLKDLAVVLGKGAASQVAISKKLQAVHKKSRTLAKPLEKLVENKVKRQTGFIKAKQLLNRWDNVVENNKVADQLSFPIVNTKMKVKVRETNIFSVADNPKTELEKEIYKALRESQDMNKEEEKQKKDDNFPMTLKEVLEQRREAGRLKHQATQQQIKTWKQNKSKSKKYHRILKKERLRNQIKEFELLKETNPEEALRRLDQLERSRAQERASLRHKNTGHWAQNKAIRAKYDRECRQNLAEQLSIGRELSQKVQMESDSSDSDGEASDLIVAPDLAPLEGDVSQFVSGYRKFWEQKKVSANTATTKVSVNDVTKNVSVNGPATQLKKVTVNDPTTQLLANNKQARNNEGQLKVLEKEVHRRDGAPKKKKLKQHVINDDDIVEVDVSSDMSPVSKQSNGVTNSSKLKRANKIKKPRAKKLKPICDDDIMEVEPSLDINNRPQKSKSLTSPEAKELNNSWVVTNIKDDIIKTKKAKSMKNIRKTNGNVDIVEASDSIESIQQNLLKKALKHLNKDCKEPEKHIEKKDQRTDGKTRTKEKKHNKNKSSSSGTVKKVTVSLKKNQEIQKAVNHPLKKKSAGVDNTSSIFDMFDSVEKKQEDLVIKSLNRLKKYSNESEKQIEKKNQRTVTKKRKQKNKKDSSTPEKVIVSLRDNQEVVLAVNHPLEEHAAGVEGTSSSPDEVQTLLNVSEGAVKSAVLQSDIDPTKFLEARPLKSRRAELILTGVEDLDDMEQDEAEKHNVALAEAFADDDVVDAFRSEKESLIEASKPKNVDLTLPGWGEWTGGGASMSKRKRKRFVLKPTVEAPRRDRNKHNVILYEGKSSGIENHQVNALPYPYRNVKDFEASLRAPIGRTWIPETAHRMLTAPRVVTRQGQVIEPMDEDALLDNPDAKKHK